METIKGGAVRLGEQLKEAKKRKESCCKPPKLLMAALHMEGLFSELKQWLNKRAMAL